MKLTGTKSDIYEPLYKIFAQVGAIDFERIASEGRGFIITLDRQTRLFFYQDGDHYSYDGFECGEYGKGDVSALD